MVDILEAVENSKIEILPLRSVQFSRGEKIHMWLISSIILKKAIKEIS